MSCSDRHGYDHNYSCGYGYGYGYVTPRLLLRLVAVLAGVGPRNSSD